VRQSYLPRVGFLSADAVGRPSPLKTIFGGLKKDEFAKKMNTFMQRICDSLYEGEFEIFLTDGAKVRKATDEATKAKEAAATPPSQGLPFGQPPLTPGKKYTVRPHPQGGFGIYEPLSPVCLQRHLTQDAAWEAIDAVNAVPPSGSQMGTPAIVDTGVPRG